MMSGARRDRTDDLLNAIQALSQLSYGPISYFNKLFPNDLPENLRDAHPTELLVRRSFNVVGCPHFFTQQSVVIARNPDLSG